MIERGHPCPWCDGTDTEQLGDSGSLLMTAQWYCNGCHSAFETIRKRGEEGASPVSGAPPAGRPGSGSASGEDGPS